MPVRCAECNARHQPSFSGEMALDKVSRSGPIYYIELSRNVALATNETKYDREYDFIYITSFISTADAYSAQTIALQRHRFLVGQFMKNFSLLHTDIALQSHSSGCGSLHRRWSYTLFRKHSMTNDCRWGRLRFTHAVHCTPIKSCPIVWAQSP